MTATIPTDKLTTAPAATHGPVTAPAGRRWLGAVLAATIMNLLDSTVINVAAPSIRADLGGSYSSLQWIAAGSRSTGVVRQGESWTPLEHLACDRAAGSVLDIGCGAGRHAVALAGPRTGCHGAGAPTGAAAVARARGVSLVEGAIEQPHGELAGFDTCC